MIPRQEQFSDTISRLFPSKKRGFSSARTITFQVTDACSLKCSYCGIAGSKILMSDYSYKNIEDIVVGDEVMGFNENIEKGKQRKLFPTKVTHLYNRYSEVIEIKTVNGTKITVSPEHPILSGKGKWKRAEDFSPKKDKLNVFTGVRDCFSKEEVLSIIPLEGIYPVYNFETDSHTYIMQNVMVHNCYQINKGAHSMTLNTAKKFIELVLHDNGYLDSHNSDGVVIEFIGGEPFLEIELIDKITSYFIQRMIELNHPWATKFRISICSNGVAYFNPKVQEYIKKYFRVLSFSISIDGNKELHDSCRVFPDGSGSYDIAMAGVKHYTEVLGGVMGSKMTIAPQNVIYVFEAVKSLIENGYTDINLNCVYEKGWTIEHAKELYKQLNKLGDYIIENNLMETHRFSIFEENMFFKPKKEGDDDNWCFSGDTLILTPKGEKRIDSLREGDIVETYDGKPHTVKRVISHIANNGCIIKAKNLFSVNTTLEHPFLTKRDCIEWISVKDLSPKDKIGLYYKTLNKKEISANELIDEKFNVIWTEIESITKIDEPCLVYNLTVNDEHTFIANGAVVHNCGGNGKMISVDYKGDIYPCIRYMESSLGTDIEPIIIGNVDTGILKTEKEIQWNNCLQCVNRRTQSTDDCYYCPIASGCSHCTAYNYQEFGTPDKKATYICIMHIARALANVRLFNKYYLNTNQNKVFVNHVPEEWALEIISEDEWNFLKWMEKGYEYFIK